MTEPAIVRLNWILGAALALWISDFGFRIAERRLKRSPTDHRPPITDHRSLTTDHKQRRSWLFFALVVALLLLGWFMAVNSRAMYDSQFYLFVPVTQWWPGGMGSVDQAVSVAAMVRVTVLLGVIVMVAELVQSRRWLMRLWWTMGLGGGSIALLGLMQKASGAPMIFWREAERPNTTFFATFFYHGNAGAFINLTLPLTIGLAWRSFSRPTRPSVRAVAIALAVSNAVAVFANTSRMSQALGAGLLLVLAVALLPKAFGVARGRLQWPTAVAGVIALSFALYAVVQTSQLDRSFARWENVGGTVSGDARWNAAKAAWAAVPEAGWNGFGPGTFATVFPYFTAGQGKNLAGRWIFLHQDYLQTAMEWGWVGSGLLALLFFGGMGVGASGALRAARAGLLVNREELLGNCSGVSMTAGTFAAELSVNRERLLGEAGAEPAEKTYNQEPRTTNPHGAATARAWAPRQRMLVALVLLGLASVALHALVDFPLQIASIQLYVAVYLGVCWGSSRFAGHL